MGQVWSGLVESGNSFYGGSGRVRGVFGKIVGGVEIFFINDVSGRVQFSVLSLVRNNEQKCNSATDTFWWSQTLLLTLSGGLKLYY